MNFRRIQLPHKILQILKLGRFHFPLGGLFIFLSGAFLSLIFYDQFSWIRLIGGYLVLFTAHLSVSYSNDYFDWEGDQISRPTLFAGGSGVLVETPELLSLSKYLALILIFISLILAIIFSITFSTVTFLILAIIGNILAWFYSAPPIKLTYRGWGELATMFTGFIIPALGYVSLTGYVDIPFLLFSIPLMIYQLLFIISVEIPDKKVDEKSGKNTFIVKKGIRYGLITINLLAIMGTGSFILLGWSEFFLPLNFYYIALFSLIPLIICMRSLLNYPSLDMIKWVNFTVSSLFVLIILVDVYLLLLVLNLI